MTDFGKKRVCHQDPAPSKYKKMMQDARNRAVLRLDYDKDGTIQDDEHFDNDVAFIYRR